MRRIVLPAVLDNLEKFLAFVTDCAEAMGLDPKTRQRLFLASEEVIVNIIHYAYPEGTGDIEIHCEKAGRDAVFLFKDWGIPFDPCAVPDPDTDLPIEKRHVGGMGIYLVKKMIPGIRYGRRRWENRLTFVIPLQGETE